MRSLPLFEHARDQAIKEVWSDLHAGRITATEAERRDALLRARKPRRLKGRKYIPSPDRAASRRRRRELAVRAERHMPNAIADHFTEAERAAMVVIGRECRHHGRCELATDAIAAQAGCGRTTVHNALRRAQDLKLIEVRGRRVHGAKSATNVVTVVHSDWVKHLTRRGTVVGFKPPDDGRQGRTPYKNPYPTPDPESLSLRPAATSIRMRERAGRKAVPDRQRRGRPGGRA